MIDKNTTKEELMKKSLEPLVELYYVNDACSLKLDLIRRVSGIKDLIYSKKGIKLSFEETLLFLDKAVSFEEVQIWLGDINSKDFSKKSRIEALLARTSDNDIVRLYRNKENYNQNNLQSIDKMIEESAIETAYGMQVDESGNNTLPTITKESRKKLAKTLINRK